MAYDGTPVLAESPLENGQWTGQFTGKEGNKGYQYYDATTGQYRKVPLADYYAMRDDTGWFQNKDGEFVHGIKPAESYDAGQGIIQEGKDPDPYVYNPANDNPDFTTGRGDTAPDVTFGGGYVDGGTGDNFQEGAYDPTEQPGYRPPSVGDSTSWDWGQFGSNNPTGVDNAPPYSTDFTLGEDSPWGNEGTPGGNEEFYNKQFNNLTRQSQAHQQQQMAAGIRRQMAAENPREATEMDWSWANNGQGLPNVDVAGSSDEPRYNLREGFDTNTTNYEIMQAALGAGWNDNDSGYPVGPDNPQLTGTNWANATNPNDLYASMPQGADETWSEMLRKGMNYAFTDGNIESPTGGGPVAAPGYALPIGSK
jgi:hypothetical protein